MLKSAMKIIVLKITFVETFLSLNISKTLSNISTWYTLGRVPRSGGNNHHFK